MWQANTYWFDATVATGLLLIGHILFGRFEDHKPRWRRLTKAALGVAIYLAIAILAGRAWGYAFIGAIVVGVIVVHGWWLPKQGVNGWTAEPRARYNELIAEDPMQKRPVFPLLFGIAFLAGAVLINVQQQRIQRGDVRDVTALRSELDSVQAALTRAATSADSSRLTQSVEQRTRALGWREFHIPSRQATIDGWWTLTGPGTALSLVGTLLVALAVVSWRRARTQR